MIRRKHLRRRQFHKEWHHTVLQKPHRKLRGKCIIQLVQHCLFQVPLFVVRSNGKKMETTLTPGVMFKCSKLTLEFHISPLLFKQIKKMKLNTTHKHQMASQKTKNLVKLDQPYQALLLSWEVKSNGWTMLQMWMSGWPNMRRHLMLEFLIIKSKKPKKRKEIHLFKLIQRWMCPINQDLFLKDLHHINLREVLSMESLDLHIHPHNHLLEVRNNGQKMLTISTIGVTTIPWKLTLEFHTCLHLFN